MESEFPPTPTVRLGMLTPSSNTVLEPVITRMAAALPDVSLHFARFRVTEISLEARALGQFDMEPMLTAADLLADARVSNICWNGTSAGWLGFDRDRALCQAIAQRTGIHATSSVLALDQLFRRAGIRRFGLITPYTDDVQARTVATFSAEGYECVAERHTGERVNFAFAEIPPAKIAARIREVAEAQPEAIVVFCTNMWGGPLAASMEAELGIPILDTVATALWGALEGAGASAARVKGWGRLFAW
jgi:maleate isomerase